MRDGGHAGDCLLLLIDAMVETDHGGLDVDVVLGAGHEQVDVVSFGEGAGLVLADLFLDDVGLVGEDEDGDVFDCELSDLLHPDLDGVEGGLVSDRVDQQDAHGRAVVGGREAAEALLPRRVPQLDEDVAVADGDHALPVVHAHRAGLLLAEAAVAELAQDGGFADVAVANEQVLDHLVVGPRVHQIISYKYMQNSLRGKQIKDYLLGEELLAFNDMHLLEATRHDNSEVTVLMIEKRTMQQDTFVSYNNLLSENKHNLHPRYIEAVQSANNIYIVVEKIAHPTPGVHPWAQLLPGIVDLYRRMGEFKLAESEVFVTGQGRVVYMPFYKRLQLTSMFYAQFHNKSVLGDLFARLAPTPNKNIALDIFIRHIDSPNAVELITADISREVINEAREKGERQRESLHETSPYPPVEFEDDVAEEQAIMQLMSSVKVNSNMKKEAGEQFIRLSARREEEKKEDRELNNIIDNVQSSMFKMEPVKRSTNHSKMEVKLSHSAAKLSGLGQCKADQNTFDLYFKSYFESLRFLKRSIKEFLSYYKNGFAGIISSFLLVLILTLRKAYMIRDLEQRTDIFDLGINMREVQVGKYAGFLRREMKGEARMIAEFKTVVENCSMPMKTYSILAPYLEDDLSAIDLSQLHSFTFFFLSALLKGKDVRHRHFLHVIDSMYILLHRNYEIVFFESDFPAQWDQKYFDEKVALIGSLVPSWS